MKQSLLEQNILFPSKYQRYNPNIVGTSQSPRPNKGVSPLRAQAQTHSQGFKILKNMKMPEKGPRRMARLEFLMQRPAYKPTREKSLLLPIHERNNSPMTMEDKSFINDRIYIYSLRKNIDSQGNPIPQNSMHNTNQTNQTGNSVSTTLTNPFSFYEDDYEKWKKRFQPHIQERQEFKKRYYTQLDVNPFVQNTNVLNQTFISTIQKPLLTTNNKEDEKNKTINGGETEYKKVMTRRKSRQSTFAPLNVDIDYSGNTSTFQHLIGYRKGQTMSPNKTQLDFEMKLRAYKNDTGFIAPLPFKVQNKQFSEKEIYEKEQGFIKNSIRHYNEKFNDTFYEKNCNNLAHLYDKNGTIYSTMWECTLRDDKKKKNLTTQPSPLKNRKNPEENE